MRQNVLFEQIFATLTESLKSLMHFVHVQLKLVSPSLWSDVRRYIHIQLFVGSLVHSIFV